MKKIIINITKNQVVMGSIILLFGSNIANVIAYLYHFILGPLLGKADYGELVVFLSIISLLSSSYSFLGLLVMKIVSAEKEKQKAVDKFTGLISQFQKLALIIMIFLLILIPLSDYFQIHVITAILIPPIFILSFLLFLYKSYLQGNLNFYTLSFASILEILLRLVFAFIFIKIGLRSVGAELGFLLSVLFLWLALKRYIPKVKKQERGITYKQFAEYGLPILLCSVATTAFFTVDVLLVRVFFTASESGIYGAAATLGKMVLFSTIPITGVLFPLISKKHSEGTEGTRILLLSLCMTVGIGGVFATAFYFIPNFIVSTLYRNSFVEASPLLFPFSLFMLFLVLSLVFVNYYLPRERYFPVKALFVGALSQIVGIVIFHTSLLEVIDVSMTVCFTLFVTLLVYFCYENKSFRKYLSKAFSYYPRVQS